MLSDPAVQRLLMRCGFVLLGLALVVVGLWLARRARRAGRRGSAPHCFQCGYNLTGLSLPDPNQRCPECGAQLSAPRAVALGRPTLHILRLGVGLSLTVAGGFTAIVFATQIHRTNWMHLKPASWLLQDARATDAVRASVARNELCYRLDRRRLSAEDEDTFLDHLLDLQASPQLAHPNQFWIQRLPDAYATGRLSAEQAERFLRDVVVFSLDVRPVVPPDSPLLIRLYAEERFVSKFPVDAQVASLTCDGHELEVDLEQLHLRWPWYGIRQQTVHASPPPPGTHEIQAVVHVTVHRQSESLHESTRELRATFEVLASRPPNLIRLQPDPALTPELRASFTLHQALAVPALSRATRRPCAELIVYLYARNSMPADVAFEVFAEFEGGSVSLGELAIRSGEPTRPTWKLTGELRDSVPDEIRVRLVASANAALRTVDLEQIWDGELDLGPIPVENAERVRQWLQEAQTGE